MPAITEYCANPSDYVNLYPLETISYFNNICKTIKNGQNDTKTDIAKIAGLTWDKDKKFLKGAYGVLMKALSNMIMSLVSPEGIKMISIFLGVDFGVKTLYKLISNYFAKGLTDDLIDLSAKVSADAAIDVASANVAVITSELAGEMGGVLAKGTGIGRVLEGIGWLVGGVMDIFMILQVMSMVFAAWDPCHYNTKLDKKSMEKFTTSFNKMYRENGVIAYNSFTDAYGKTEYLNIWPIEFTGTKFLLDIHTSKEYKLEYTRYTARYLASLRINSLGEPIYLPNGGISIYQLNQAHWQEMEQEISNFFADGNTVVGNSLMKFWPIFIILAIVILIFIIYIVK